jgi:nitroreductase
MPDKWPDQMKSRYKELGKTLYASLSIKKDDVEKQTAYLTNLFTLFNAPALILLTVDQSISLEYAMLDCGLFLQNFCLLAHNQGLGTCIMAASVSYPEIIRNLIKLGKDKKIVIGAALGWPDWDSPINQFQRTREDLDKFLNWIN